MSIEQPTVTRKSIRQTIKSVDYAPEIRIIKQRDNRKGLKYQTISDDIKQRFIEEVTKQNGTIKAAAEKFEINFSTAKAILHTYRKEGRVGRKIRRHNKNSCFQKIKKRLPKLIDSDGNSSSDLKPRSSKSEVDNSPTLMQQQQHYNSLPLPLPMNLLYQQNVLQMLYFYALQQQLLLNQQQHLQQ